MKRFLFILLLVCISCKQPTELPKQGIEDIIEETPMLKVSKSSAMPDQLYEMTVLHSSYVINGEKKQLYWARLYCEVKDFGGFGHPDDKIYDKFFYRWENDSLVKFRIFNSTNNNSVSFTYSCIGRESWFRTDSINGVPIDSIPH